MLITEMTDPESRALLARLGSGRLASARNNQPYIVPVYFACEGDAIYGFSTLGRKIEWMRLNPLVCIQADEVRSHFDWQSVVVLGHYEELSDDAEHRKVRARAVKLLANRSLWWQGAYATDRLREHEGDPLPVVFCVHIGEITGHRADPDPTEIKMGIAPPQGG
jgi:nitroimidazol reductase NimA-like FMN-containing flavoprotein (pyridoxamine 5'-phosphate oxidase superfamily)